MKIILFILILGCAVFVRAEDRSEGATSAPAMLNLPTATVVGPDVSGPRSEIEGLWKSGEKKQANKKLEKWMSKNKTSPWPWVVSAQMQCEEKKFKKCVSLATAAINKAPDCAEAYYWKGRGLEGLNKPLDAANEYQAALAGKNKFAEAQKDLDRVLAMLGQ